MILSGIRRSHNIGNAVVILYTRYYAYPYLLFVSFPVLSTVLNSLIMV